MFPLVKNRLVFLLGALLAMMVVGSCIRDDYSSCPDMEGVRQIRLAFSTRQMQMTKADPLTNHSYEEARLHSLRLWVFNSGTDQQAIGYEELSSARIDAITDIYGTVSLVLEIPASRIGPSGNLDFYIAANCEAVGLDLGENWTRSSLETVSFSNFTPAEGCGSVPDKGLPISRIVRNVDSATKQLSIPLVRAVSKLRFFFAAPTGLSGASVVRVQLDGNGIATDERFFPNAITWSPDLGSPSEANIISSAGYHAEELGFVPSPADLHYTDDPAQYAPGATENAQDWLDRLDNAGFAQCGLVYLKETDRALSGTIYYTMQATGSEVRSARFSLDAGGFVRNHDWIVYAFFDKDRLFVRPLVADWTDGGVTDFIWSYTNTFVNMTGAENTKTIDVAGETCVMAAYGTASSGLPYSPKLSLTAASAETTVATMRLQTDNPDYGFIIDDAGVLSTVQNYINIPLRPEPATIVFYVVPTSQFDLAGPNPPNPEAHLYLYLIGDSFSSFRLPFNSIDMPGNHESVRFYYVPADMFK